MTIAPSALAAIAPCERSPSRVRQRESRRTRADGSPLANRPVHASVFIDGQSYGPDGKPAAGEFPFRTDANGSVDVTFKLPDTIEVGLRVLAGRGSIVQMGLSSMARCEWTPWYFKEARLVGSNAFGYEVVDGVRKHAMEHYLDLVRSGRIDLTGMLTHTFLLADWRDAFRTLIDQGTTGAVKCAFDFR